MKGTIFVNIKKCLGCKTCEVECAISHSPSKNLIEVLKGEISSLPRISLEEIEKSAIPLQCCHCEAAPCLIICPTKAIFKEKKTGAIVIDQNLCIGCQSCIIVCPYGIPQKKKNGKVITKCDFCFEKLQENQLPACVSGCPTKSLRFIEIKD